MMKTLSEKGTVLRLEGEMIYFYAMLQKQPEKEVE